MDDKNSDNKRPFWRDGNSYLDNLPFAQARRIFRLAFDGLFLLVFIYIGFLVRAIPFLWIAIAIPIFFRIIKIYFYWREDSRKYNAREIQEIAHHHTGADKLGSAIHVAGHPLLERDQEVVLALGDRQLSIYDYDISSPIVVFGFDELTKVQTVSYDDNRVPLVDVIDSAAQALLLTFDHEGETYSALFRRMLKIKPIDWYHAIMQAKPG